MRSSEFEFLPVSQHMDLPFLAERQQRELQVTQLECFYLSPDKVVSDKKKKSSFLKVRAPSQQAMQCFPESPPSMILYSYTRLSAASSTTTFQHSPPTTPHIHYFVQIHVTNVQVNTQQKIRESHACKSPDLVLPPLLYCTLHIQDPCLLTSMFSLGVISRLLKISLSLSLHTSLHGSLETAFRH